MTKAEMFDDLHFCLHVHLRAKIDHSSQTGNTILLYVFNVTS